MVCPRCGNILDDSETCCKNCGTKIKEAVIAPKSPVPETVKQEQVSASPKLDVNVQPVTPEKTVVSQPATVVEKKVEQVSNVETVKPVVENTVVQEVKHTVIDPQEYEALQQQLAAAKKNNNISLAIVVTLIVVFSIFGGVLLLGKMRGTGTTSSLGSTQSSSKNIVPEDQVVTDPGTSESGKSGSSGGSGSSQKAGSNVSVEVNGYVFPVPSIYQTEIKNGMGISIDYTNKVQLVYCVMHNTPYSKAVVDAAKFGSDLETMGFMVNNYREYSYGGRRWLIYHGVLGKNPAMYAITMLGSDNTTFQSTIYNLGTKTEAVLFSELTTMVNGAKVKSSSSGSSGSGSSKGNSGSNGTGKPNTPSPGAVVA